MNEFFVNRKGTPNNPVLSLLLNLELCPHWMPVLKGLALEPALMPWIMVLKKLYPTGPPLWMPYLKQYIITMSIP
jgi:hypothetical protein